jgi:hypothetical protein
MLYFSGTFTLSLYSMFQVRGVPQTHRQDYKLVVFLMYAGRYPLGTAGPGPLQDRSSETYTPIFIAITPRMSLKPAGF